MKIGIQKVVDVDVKTVEISLKVRDEGSYLFRDAQGDLVKQLSDCYVPSFGANIGGDYMNLVIDIETGRILNWDLDRAELEEMINDSGDL